jgi:hypothetical protein
MRNRSVEAVAGITINPIGRNLTASQKEFVTGRRPLAPPLRRDVPLWHGPARSPAAPRERSAYGEVLARRGGCHLQRPLTGRRRRGSVRRCDGSPQRATSRPTAPVAPPGERAQRGKKAEETRN